MHSTATELERTPMRPAAATRPYALIVEDEPALVELIRYNLIKEGYEVSTAQDGEEALLLIEERQPDIVLLDWMLPKLAGIEVARRLREVGPVIAAEANETERQRFPTERAWSAVRQSGMFYLTVPRARPADLAQHDVPGVAFQLLGR